MAQNFIALMARIAKLEAQVRELTTRVPPIQLTTVTDISEARRMIKVTREAQAHQSQGDWIQAGRRSCFEDEPLPSIGTTALVAYAEGNPHDGYLLRTLTNDTNPLDPVQGRPAKDNTAEIPGDDRRIIAGKSFDSVGGDRTQETQGNLGVDVKRNITIDSTEGSIEVTALHPDTGVITVRAFETIRLEDNAGAFIQISNGVVTVQDAEGRSWTLGNGQWVFDVAAGELQIVNAANVSINGKSVLTLGSVDTGGYINITKGY